MTNTYHHGSVFLVVYIAPYDNNLYYAVRHFYCFAITSSYNAQLSLTLNDLTLLEEIFIALLHR